MELASIRWMEQQLENEKEQTKPAEGIGFMSIVDVIEGNIYTYVCTIYKW